MNSLIAFLVVSAGFTTSDIRSEYTLERMRVQAPGAAVEALRLALRARQCALEKGEVVATTRLAVIDYSRPSTQTRLWVFDLAKAPRLLFAEHVAHGQGTGGNRAVDFSNREGSRQSSLGLFRTSEPYYGQNGYSLRLDGLEPGFNDLARARAIVMHGAPYVDPVVARQQGRLGRSFGCPAVRKAIARPLIDTLRDGQLLFAYFPDQAWLAESSYLSCDATSEIRADTAASGRPRAP